MAWCFYLKRETWVWSQSIMTLSVSQMTSKTVFLVQVVLKNVQKPSNRYIQTLNVWHSGLTMGLTIRTKKRVIQSLITRLNLFFISIGITGSLLFSNRQAGFSELSKRWEEGNEGLLQYRDKKSTWIWETIQDLLEQEGRRNLHRQRTQQVDQDWHSRGYSHGMDTKEYAVAV